MSDKYLGKIERVYYGMGGYDDAMFGLTIVLTTQYGDVCDFKGTWTTRSEQARYSIEEWQLGHLGAALFTMNLLRDAKKKRVEDLVGTPIEAEFEGSTLKSWRVLTEVL